MQKERRADFVRGPLTPFYAIEGAEIVSAQTRIEACLLLRLGYSTRDGSLTEARTHIWKRGWLRPISLKHEFVLQCNQTCATMD